MGLDRINNRRIKLFSLRALYVLCSASVTPSSQSKRDGYLKDVSKLLKLKQVKHSTIFIFCTCYLISVTIKLICFFGGGRGGNISRFSDEIRILIDFLGFRFSVLGIEFGNNSSIYIYNTVHMYV